MNIDSGMIKTGVGLVAFAVAAASIVRLITKNTNPGMPAPEDVVIYESPDTGFIDTLPEMAEDDTGSGYDRLVSDRKVNENTHVQIEKILIKISDDGCGNRDLEYGGYYVSDIDLYSLTDETSDYTDCLSEDGFDETKIVSMSFTDAFGFSYEGCRDMSEFFDLARKQTGFDADMSDASYDDEKYEYVKEESYEFNSPCSILYSMIGDMDEEKLLRSSCTYTLSEMGDGTKYPQMFTAIVQYEEDGVFYTDTVYLGFSYYKDGESAGCGCGTSDECVTCEDECGCNDDCGDICPSCGGEGGCTEDCTGDCCR